MLDSVPRKGQPCLYYRLGNERMVNCPAERDLGILVDSKLNVRQQCALAAKRAKCTLGCIKHGRAVWAVGGVVLLCTSWSHLLHWVQFGCYSTKNIKLLHSVQRRATGGSECSGGKMYENWLRCLL